MNCSQFRHFYSDFADGLIEEADEVAFHIHMAECQACARFDEALQEGRRALKGLKAPEPSGDFDDRLFERIMAECEEDRSPLRHHKSGLASAALVVALLGVVGWQARNALSPAREPRQSTRANANATDAFTVRFNGDTSTRFPGKLPVLPVSRDTLTSPSRPARSFEITVDWMTP